MSVSQESGMSKEMLAPDDDDDEKGKGKEDEKKEEEEIEYMKLRQARIKKLKREFEKVVGEDGRLAQSDFRKALRSRNAFFTDRLFAMFDKKKEGLIALEEFIEFVLSIKTVDDKIDLLYSLYDTNDDDALDQNEILTVIKAMVSESQLELNGSDIDKLAEYFYRKAVTCSKDVAPVKGPDEGPETITREGFKKLLTAGSEGLSNDVSTLIDHWIGAVEDAEKDESKEQDMEDRAIDEATKDKANPTLYYFFLVYVVIIVAMMVTAGVLYKDAKDASGGVNIWVLISRIFGFPLNFIVTFTYACMLTIVLNALRGLGAIRLLPLDHNLLFHTLSGWIIFVFGYIHTLSNFINFRVNVQPDPENYLVRNGLWHNDSSYRPPEQPGQRYSYAEWMLTTKPGLFGLIPGWANVTGLALIILATLLLASSEDCVRRGGYFSLFFYAHLSYIPFAVLLIIHAPSFSYFFPICGLFLVLGLIDRAWLCTCRRKTHVTTGILLPGSTFCVVCEKPDLKAHSPGDWIYVNIPSIAVHEWHAFTITSSPDFVDVFTLHIKVAGHWTKALHRRLEADYARLAKEEEAGRGTGVPPPDCKRNLHHHHQYSQVAKNIPYDKPSKSHDLKDGSSMLMFVHGPFSSPATGGIFMAEHAVLIATGTGVNKIIPILHTILHRHLSTAHLCSKCDRRWCSAEENRLRLGPLRKVDFVWIVRDPTEVSWFLDLLAEIDLEQEPVEAYLPKIVDSHIYVTRALAKTDMCAVALRLALNLVYRNTKRDVVYGLRSKMVAGRPNLNEIFSTLEKARSGHVSVFYSGDTSVGDILLEKCEKFKFSFHNEIF